LFYHFPDLIARWDFCKSSYYHTDRVESSASKGGRNIIYSLFQA
jgi:hypothetical protein